MLEKIGTALVLLKIVEILPHYFLIMNLFIAYICLYTYPLTPVFNIFLYDTDCG